MMTVDNDCKSVRVLLGDMFNSLVIARLSDFLFFFGSVYVAANVV